MMTCDSIRARVEQIRAQVRVDATDEAHCAEDRLHCDVLHAIADGTIDDAREAARLAWSTREIVFPRWFA